jgi:MFS family permease
MDEQRLQKKRSRAAEIVVAAALLFVTMAVNLAAPLYRSYGQAAGYGNGLTAVVFALYIVGLLPTLIFLGGISDYVGCRTVVLYGLAATTLATMFLVINPTIYALMVARVLHGIGVALSIGAGTVYLANLMGNGSKRASVYVGVVTSFGFGGGPLLTSITLLPGQTLVPLSFWAVLAVSLACAVLVVNLPVQRPSGGTLLRLPYIPRAAAVPGMIFALAWSVIGLVMSIVPMLLAQHQLAGWSGAAIFCVSAAGGLCQIAARRMDSARAQMVSILWIPLGYLMLLVGAVSGMVVLALVGAAITGAACFGLAYPGGLAEVIRVGQPHQARAISGYLLCGYLGFGVPSILVGFVADRIGVTGALVIFGAVIVLTCAALAVRTDLRLVQFGKPVDVSR